MKVQLKNRVHRAANTVGLRLCKPVFRVASSTHEVFLTFDDGPHPDFTDKIATTLEEYGHRGTFFLTGNSATEHSEIVKRLDRMGHAVGSHSSQHLPQWTTRSSALLADYRSGHIQVERALGHATKLFRPPYGGHDSRSAVFALRHRLKLIMWSVDPEDWKADATAAEVSSSCSASLRPGEIVLLHDAITDNPLASDRSATVEAVAMLSDEIRRKGFIGGALQ